MVLKADQERVQALLKDTITLLCKNGLSFKTEFSIEALIGITLDKDDVFLVSINEIIKNSMESADAGLTGSPNTQPVNDVRKQTMKRTHTRSETNDSLAEKQPNDLSIVKTSHVWPSTDQSAAQVSSETNSRQSLESEQEPAVKRLSLEHVNSTVCKKEPEVVVVKEEEDEEDEEEDPLDQEYEDDWQDDTSAMTRVSQSTASTYKAGHVALGAEVSSPWSAAQNEIYRQTLAHIPTAATSNSSTSQDSFQEPDKHQVTSADTEVSNALLMQSLYKEMLLRPQTTPVLPPGVLPVYSPLGQQGAPGDTDLYPYKCEICGKRYMKRDGLVRHWKIHDTSLHRCKRCTLFFQSESQLETHITVKHTPSSLKHACTVCGKRFDRPFVLKKHMVTHSNVPYDVDGGNEMFTQSGMSPDEIRDNNIE